MSTNEKQSQLEVGLKPILAVTSLMVGVFTVLQAIWPTGLTPPIAALAAGFVLAAALVWSGKWVWQIAVFTLSGTALTLLLVHFLISQPATVTGQILANDGTPISGLSLILTNSSGVDQRVVTDQTGRFEISRVPDGRYTLTTNGKLIYTGEIPSGWQRIFNPTTNVGSLPVDISVLMLPNPTELTNQNLVSASILTDNFDDPQYDGSLNTLFWNNYDKSIGNIVQADGVLHLTKSTQDGDLWIDSKHRFPMRNPVSLEADLMIDKNKDGVIRLVLAADLSRSENFTADCFIRSDRSDGLAYLAYCTFGFSRDGRILEGYETPWIEHVEAGTWHTFRIEVTQPGMIFDLYMDGRLLGSYTPAHADIMRNAVGRLAVSVYGSNISGRVDNVVIGGP